MMPRSNIDATLVPIVENLIYISLLTFVILAALASLGIQTTSLIAIIGAAGLTVGLVRQGSLANFAAGVLKDTAPTVAALELWESSLNFAVRPWANTEDYRDVYFVTTENLKKRFDAGVIHIPFPQRDVHVHQA
jgi:small-conductance mechanosensitive channel